MFINTVYTGGDRTRPLKKREVMVFLDPADTGNWGKIVIGTADEGATDEEKYAGEVKLALSTVTDRLTSLVDGDSTVDGSIKNLINTLGKDAVVDIFADIDDETIETVLVALRDMVSIINGDETVEGSITKAVYDETVRAVTVEGVLDDLTTDARDNLVASINELHAFYTTVKTLAQDNDDRIDIMLNSVGLEDDGTYTAVDSTTYLQNVTGLKDADTTLDTAIKDVADRESVAEARIKDNEDSISLHSQRLTNVDTTLTTLTTDSEEGSIYDKIITEAKNGELEVIGVTAGSTIKEHIEQIYNNLGLVIINDLDLKDDMYDSLNNIPALIDSDDDTKISISAGDAWIINVANNTDTLFYGTLLEKGYVLIAKVDAPSSLDDWRLLKTTSNMFSVFGTYQDFYTEFNISKDQ